MKKRVRTLLRVSSKQQLHDDDIPLQRAEAQHYIESQPDWEFDKEYIEKAVSAYKNTVNDREVLMEILQDAKKHEFDVLLTYMSDRIGRKEEYSIYVSTLNSYGIEVWTIKDGQLKTEEHIDKLLNYIRFWQNEGESKKTSMRVRDAQQERVRSGKFAGGKAPYGYRLVPSGEISNHGRLLKKLEIVEEHAEVVRKIYDYAIHYGMGFDRIAKALNKEGIPPVEVEKWRSSTIASILKNPVYMGYYAVNRRVNHGSFTRLDRKNWIYSEVKDEEIVIISEADWERAQEIREARKNRINEAKEANVKMYEEQYNVPFSTKGRLPLIGIAYCGYCGKRLKNGSYNNRWETLEGEQKISYVGRYYCPEKCAERGCYSQEYLDGIVFDVVERYMERLKTIDVSSEIKKMQSQQRVGIEKDLQAKKREQRALKLDIETLEEKIPDAIRGEYFFSAEKLSDMIREKEQRLKDLCKEQKEIEKRLEQLSVDEKDLNRFLSVVPNWKDEFRSADTETRKMLLAMMIDRVEVKNDSVVIKFKIQVDNFTVPEKSSGSRERESETEGGDLSPKTIGFGTIPYTHGLR